MNAMNPLNRLKIENGKWKREVETENRELALAIGRSLGCRRGSFLFEATNRSFQPVAKSCFDFCLRG
jgi:hypothetical protein